MSRVIKSRDVEFHAEAIRLPVIVPVMYEAPGKRQAIQRNVDQTAQAAADRALRDAEAKAQSIIERAKADAAKAREKARAEGFEAGRQEGLAEGRSEGRAEAAAEARGILEQARAEIEAARSEARRIVASSAAQVTEIALRVAQKVIKRAVSVDPEIVLENIRQALGSVGREDTVTVKINPVEAALVHDARDSLRHEFSGIGEIEVREDNSVEPGGCVVSTGRGTVDAQIGSQIEAVRERLVEAAAQRDSTGGCTQDN